MTKKPLGPGLFLVGALVIGAPVSAQTLIDFEGISSLSELAPLGVTFSVDIGLWEGGPVSVLDDPTGGPVSPTHGICVGSCGPGIGSIFFAQPQGVVSIYALSGPGVDNLSPGVQIEAFDEFDASLGVAIASTSLEFEKLTVIASGIRRLDLTSPLANSDAWDDLEFTLEPTPSRQRSWGAIKWFSIPKGF